MKVKVPYDRDMHVPTANGVVLGMPATEHDVDMTADEARKLGFIVLEEPVVTEPVVTEPVVTEPVVTEPVVTEPTADAPAAPEAQAPETKPKAKNKNKG